VEVGAGSEGAAFRTGVKHGAPCGACIHNLLAFYKHDAPSERSSAAIIYFCPHDKHFMLGRRNMKEKGFSPKVDRLAKAGKLHGTPRHKCRGNVVEIEMRFGFQSGRINSPQ
jgi:hypothetical protein